MMMNDYSLDSFEKVANIVFNLLLLILRFCSIFDLLMILRKVIEMSVVLVSR